MLSAEEAVEEPEPTDEPEPADELPPAAEATVEIDGESGPEEPETEETA